MQSVETKSCFFPSTTARPAAAGGPYCRWVLFYHLMKNVGVVLEQGCVKRCSSCNRFWSESNCR